MTLFACIMLKGGACTSISVCVFSLVINYQSIFYRTPGGPLPVSSATQNWTSEIVSLFRNTSTQDQRRSSALNTHTRGMI